MWTFSVKTYLHLFFIEAPSPYLSSKVSRSFSRSCTVSTHCFNPLPLPYSFVNIKIKNICKKNIEKVWYQYGSHQYLYNKPRSLHPLDLYKFKEFFLARYLQVNLSKSFLFLSSPILWNSRDSPLSCLVKFSICLLN